jgi:hypothetical protein
MGNASYSGFSTVFSNCKALTTVNIGNKVKTIPDYAFSDCINLASVTIGSSVTSIGSYAFSGCSSLPSVTIPNSVTSIGERAFSECSSLASVTIGSSVTSIGSYAFYGCSSLPSVTIPNSVTSIGDGAFYYCSGLRSVTNLNTTPQTISNNYIFDGVPISNATLYVPMGYIKAYNTADVWKGFGTITAYVPTAIDVPTAASATRVYSDPAAGSFRIEGLTVPAEVTVINTAGQTVWRQTVADGGNIPIAHLPRGVYLIHVNGQTMKIIR